MLIWLTFRKSVAEASRALYLPPSWSGTCLGPPCTWARCGRRGPRPGSGTGSCSWRSARFVSADGKGTRAYMTVCRSLWRASFYAYTLTDIYVRTPASPSQHKNIDLKNVPRANFLFFSFFTRFNAWRHVTRGVSAFYSRKHLTNTDEST